MPCYNLITYLFMVCISSSKVVLKCYHCVNHKIIFNLCCIIVCKNWVDTDINISFLIQCLHNYVFSSFQGFLGCYFEWHKTKDNWSKVSCQAKSNEIYISNKSWFYQMVFWTSSGTRRFMICYFHWNLSHLSCCKKFQRGILCWLVSLDVAAWGSSWPTLY